MNATIDLHDRINRARGIVRCLVDLTSTAQSLDGESLIGLSEILHQVENDLSLKPTGKAE